MVSTFYRVARLSLQAQAVEDSRRRSRMGKTKGFIEPKGSRRRDVRRDGRSDRYLYILGGGRGSEGEGRVYEAYEVKNKRQKLRCLLLRRKKKNIIYLFMK